MWLLQLPGCCWLEGDLKGEVFNLAELHHSKFLLRVQDQIGLWWCVRKREGSMFRLPLITKPSQNDVANSFHISSSLTCSRLSFLTRKIRLMIKYLWVVDEMVYIKHTTWGKGTLSALFESGAASSVEVQKQTTEKLPVQFVDLEGNTLWCPGAFLDKLLDT